MSQNSVHIRAVERKDNQQLAFIIKSVLEDFGGNTQGFASKDPETDAMYEAYQSEKAVYYVAELNGKVIGGAGIAQLRNAPPTTCELQKMYILKEGRGLNIGSQLIDLCLSEATKLGYLTCYLETLQGMDIAVKMYTNRGFNLLDAPLGETGHYGCNTWMIKELCE